MTDSGADVRRELVAASRILAREGIVDSFGHVSVRDPRNAGRFLLSRVKSPELVALADILSFDLDAAPVHAPAGARLFAERAIHAALYRARPDVRAVCHHHAAAVLPFCVTSVELVPVFHLGATMGSSVPVWDSRDEFGDTSLLVTSAAEGDSLARSLGAQWTVLMRRHGATVVGRNLRELVFRTIYGALNAQLQRQALQLGALTQLSPGESALASEFNLKPIAVDRAWELWLSRVLPID